MKNMKIFTILYIAYAYNLSEGNRHQSKQSSNLNDEYTDNNTFFKNYAHLEEEISKIITYKPLISEDKLNELLIDIPLDKGLSGKSVESMILQIRNVQNEIMKNLQIIQSTRMIEKLRHFFKELAQSQEAKDLVELANREYDNLVKRMEIQASDLRQQIKETRTNSYSLDMQLKNLEDRHQTKIQEQIVIEKQLEAIAIKSQEQNVYNSKATELQDIKYKFNTKMVEFESLQREYQNCRSEMIGLKYKGQILDKKLAQCLSDNEKMEIDKSRYEEASKKLSALEKIKDNYLKLKVNSEAEKRNEFDYRETSKELSTLNSHFENLSHKLTNIKNENEFVKIELVNIPKVISKVNKQLHESYSKHLKHKSVLKSKQASSIELRSSIEKNLFTLGVGISTLLFGISLFLFSNIKFFVDLLVKKESIWNLIKKL